MALSTQPAHPARHEIPTHLNVEDRVALGLSLRQVLYLLVGLASAYGAWNQWATLPDAARASLAAACLLLAGIVALCRPGRRGLDEWAVVVLRYATVPKRSAWRRCAPSIPGTGAGQRDERWVDLDWQVWQPRWADPPAAEPALAAVRVPVDAQQAREPRT